MKLAEVQIVGAMVAPEGKAAFDRAPLVVASRAAPAEYLQVRVYVEPDGIEGNPLDPEDFEALVRAEQAIRFEEPPLDAAMGVALWVLRPTFSGREAALEELRTSGVMLRDWIPFRDGSWGCLVREPAAHDLRDRWAVAAFGEALAWAKAGHWDRVRDAASRAFVVERAMSPERIAMLSLAHARCGSKVRAGGYVEMARRSRGDDFARQVLEKRADLERQMDEEAPRSGARPRFAGAMIAGNDNAMRAGLRRLRRTG